MTHILQFNDILDLIFESLWGEIYLSDRPDLLDDLFVRSQCQRSHNRDLVCAELRNSG